MAAERGLGVCGVKTVLQVGGVGSGLSPKEELREVGGGVLV